VAERVVVGRVEEIPPGQRRLIVPFRGRAGIGVFNIRGTFHALRNLCPHKSGPLCTGYVWGRTVADRPPSGLPLIAEGHQVERRDDFIRCPWHLWEFEIATGQCMVDPKVRVKTYPVSIENGQVVVYADSGDLPPQPG
jgi:nitrite reductase/ring-hydroxylating ferredoxin subunit